MADAAVDMSVADAAATADHEADLATLLAAGKWCKVCAPAVPRDGVRGGPVPAHERAGIGLLTQEGDRIELRLANKKLDDGCYTFSESSRSVEACDLSDFVLLCLIQPPCPPPAPCTRAAALRSVAVGLMRPSYMRRVPGERRRQSSLGGVASECPLGLLSGSTFEGDVTRDGGWKATAALISAAGDSEDPFACRDSWEADVANERLRRRLTSADERGASVFCCGCVFKWLRRPPLTCTAVVQNWRSPRLLHSILTSYLPMPSESATHEQPTSVCRLPVVGSASRRKHWHSCGRVALF